MTKVWVTLHHKETVELLLNIAHIESIAEYDNLNCQITMTSGKVWKITEYDVDELVNLFDEQTTT